MSMVRTKLESKVILDFSEGKLTKHRIRQSLRNVEMVEQFTTKNITTLRDNIIQIGMYRIHIYPYAISTEPRRRIKEYGGMGFVIYERKLDECGIYWSKVPMGRDARFNNKQWLKLNKSYKIRIKHLTDIIHHCHKLDKLRVFL